MSSLFGPTVRVLSIDGGGVRGIIPSLVLEELQRRLRIRGEMRPFHRIFDLMAGTSAGGIIVLGLALPALSPDGSGFSRNKAALDVSKITALFSVRGLEIFPRPGFAKFKSILHAFGEKYSADSLESLLERLFGDATMNDALTNLIITSYDVERREPHMFKKRPVRHGKHDVNFYMRDAARATSAAPTYFAPAYVEPRPPDGERYCLVDGAVFANNPALAAYIEARKIFPHARKYVIISLGTGQAERRFTYEQIKDWGYLEWVSPRNGVPLFSLSSEGQSVAVVHQLSRIPDVEFYRLDGPLSGDASESMDNAAAANIERLTAAAMDIISDNDRMMEKICARLS
ncbi:MAG TPA: patatin-like phospholipase family protein [Spirochaetia bacterium]|nr:patatin-like phospholipase family protein [Spirochaetia bacterium]